jgi:hypothetical protein
MRRLLDNAFEKASLIEAEAMKDIIPFIQRNSWEGRLVLTAKGNLSKELQKQAGDILFNGEDQRLWAVELKAEVENLYNNFFLETWSNRRRFTLGWMFTIQSDVLLYYFLKEKELYSISIPKLKAWAFEGQRIYNFPEKRQGKYDQKNDTWGRCVPIETIRHEVGFKFYNLTAPEELCA